MKDKPGEHCAFGLKVGLMILFVEKLEEEPKLRLLS